MWSREKERCSRECLRRETIRWNQWNRKRKKLLNKVRGGCGRRSPDRLLQLESQRRPHIPSVRKYSSSASILALFDSFAATVNQPKANRCQLRFHFDLVTGHSSFYPYLLETVFFCVHLVYVAVISKGIKLSPAKTTDSALLPFFCVVRYGACCPTSDVRCWSYAAALSFPAVRHIRRSAFLFFELSSAPPPQPSCSYAMSVLLAEKDLVTPTHSVHYNYLFKSPAPGKPTLLFLHGFPESRFCWRNQLPFVAQLGYGVIAPDLLGYGKTAKPGDAAEFKYKRQIESILDILDHEGVKKFVVLGHDWYVVHLNENSPWAWRGRTNKFRSLSG